MYVPHPLAVHVRRANVELVAIQDEPNRDLVGLPCLAPIVGQPRGLPTRYTPQSRKCDRFRKLSLADFNMNQQKLNIPKLLLGHAETVPQFVYKRLTDLMSDFSLNRDIPARLIAFGVHRAHVGN